MEEHKGCGCTDHSEHGSCTDQCCCGGDHEGHGHHHHHHNPDEVDVLLLTMEDGTQLECLVLGVFDAKDKEYMVLLPKDESEVMVFQYNQTEEGLELLPVEDEEVLEMVAKAFEEAR